MVISKQRGGKLTNGELEHLDPEPIDVSLAWIIFYEPVQVRPTSLNEFGRRKQALGYDYSANIAAQLIAITKFALRRRNPVALNHWRKVDVPAVHAGEINTPEEIA